MQRQEVSEDERGLIKSGTYRKNGGERMMEKVKVSREVAEAIERLRDEDFTGYGIILSTGEKHENTNIEVLRKWTYRDDAEKLLAALVNGYEIEEHKPKFKEGDKVVTTWEGSKNFYTLLKFYAGITNPVEGRGWYLVNQPFGIHEKHIRHATPEEIYWLETLGRKKVNDFQKGDAVLDADGSLNRLTTQYHIDQAISWYRDRPEELIGIYPDESFKPFSGGDEE